MTQINTEVNFVEMAGDIQVIKKLLLGNGVIGLCERVENLEQAQINSSKTKGFFTGLWVVVGGAITYLLNCFKG